MRARHRHAGTRRLSLVKRRAVAAEHGNRRPLRQHWNRLRSLGCELRRRMNDAAAYDGENGFDSLDVFFRDAEVVVRERDDIGELAGGNRTLLVALAGEPAAPLR